MLCRLGLEYFYFFVQDDVQQISFCSCWLQKYHSAVSLPAFLAIVIFDVMATFIGLAMYVLVTLYHSDSVADGSTFHMDNEYAHKPILDRNLLCLKIVIEA